MSEENFALILFIAGIGLSLVGLLILTTGSIVRGTAFDTDSIQRRLLLQSAGGVLIVVGGGGLLASVVFSIANLLDGAQFKVGEAFMLGLLGIICIPCAMTGLLLITAGGRLRRLRTFSSEVSLAFWVRMSQIYAWTLVIVGTLSTFGVSLLLIPIAHVTVRLARSERISRHGMLLWSLCIAAEKRLPLAPELEAFANANTGLHRARALEVATLLRSGYSLGAALERAPELLPEQEVLAIRVGDESGTLAPALRQAALNYTARQQQAVEASGTGVAPYLLFCLTVGAAILWFLMYYIVPKFKRIFFDFNVNLPAVTNSLIQVSEYGFLLVPVISIALATFIAVMVAEYQGWEEWRSTLLRRWFPRFGAPSVLRNLATVIGAGRPLVSGLTTLAEGFPDMATRRRLEQVLYEVESGTSCWDAMHRAGFVHGREAAVLAAAERVRNLPWALRDTADAMQRRSWHRMRVLGEFAQPAVAIIAGLAVLYVVVGFFSPLVSLLLQLEAQTP